MLRIFTSLLVLSLLAPGLALAETAADRGTPGGHAHDKAGKEKHTPAKKAEAAELDALYSKEVAAFQDYQATGRIQSYFDSETISAQYENAVEAARFEKTVNPSYREKAAVTDFGQCCPFDDANEDGIADDFSGGTTAAAESGKTTKKETAAQLDAAYAKEEAAFRDFVSTGGKISSFYDAQRLAGEYEAAVDAAGLKNYVEKTVSVEPGQLGPTDANSDGYADGMSSDGNGGAISSGTGSASGSGSAGTFSSPGQDAGAIGDIGGIP